MKVNEDIRIKLIDGLEKSLKNFIEDVKKNIGLIKIADSVEAIMLYKQDLLRDWINASPLGTDTCYFCIKTNFHCYNCEYGEKHKICVDKLVSDWRVIRNKLGDLIDAINTRYYKNEIYLESSKRRTIYCPNCNFKYRRVLRDDSYGLCKNCGKEIK